MGKRPSLGLVAYLPGTPAKVMITTEGLFALSCGRSIEITLDGRSPAGIEIERVEHCIEWRANHGRFRVDGRMVAAPGGVGLWAVVTNPYNEARAVDLALEVRGSSGEVVSPEGLVSMPAATVRSGRLVRKLLLPPLGRAATEAALLPSSDRNPPSFGDCIAEADEVWNRAHESGGTCMLPARELDHAFRRARIVLRGCLVPGAEGRSSLWPRPGLPPAAGPVSLDALALAALAEWGAFADFHAAMEWSMKRVGPPVLESPRATWGSDAGALLWAAAKGLAAEGAGYFALTISDEVERLSALLMKDFASGSPLRREGPRLLGREVRAWNDSWTWKGLSAAAAILKLAGSKAAGEVFSHAEVFRDSIIRQYADRPKALYCLARLGVIGDREPGRDADENLLSWARIIAAAREPERELRTSVFFLRTLRNRMASECHGRTVLLNGVDSAWFADSGRLEFRGLPAGNGVASAVVFARRGGILVNVESTGSGLLSLRLPLHRAASAMVNGKPVAVSEGVISLPPGRSWDVSA